ncbi:hypothetical protein KFL_000690220 [Klebsormidium nitens]|uniref:Uncharacterized protein n=1 Tax=Klebsormidium nitens TaxID=105231 RepID=A0A1Y1HSF1_KLENI|nr:hypothetical protein KFL_000690220 [Klebsormidium nitens]|eukprot:GAQ81043.1 hypothetical protein KFL_000690220 [Klebsormidium nitens]
MMKSVDSAEQAERCNIPIADTVRFTILRGTLDEGNPLSLLRGNEHIWTRVFCLVDTWYEEHMDRKSVAFDIASQHLGPARKWHPKLISFPEPKGIQINMMPIKPHDLDLLNTLPAYCRQYYKFIEMCKRAALPAKFNQVAYLTIHESLVPIGESQRRPGLHVERPGEIRDGGLAKTLETSHRFWGGGYKAAGQNELTDGIYMASNTKTSSARRQAWLGRCEGSPSSNVAVLG